MMGKNFIIIEINVGHRRRDVSLEGGGISHFSGAQ
jgi:hypothetical protein